MRTGQPRKTARCPIAFGVFYIAGYGLTVQRGTGGRGREAGQPFTPRSTSQPDTPSLNDPSPGAATRARDEPLLFVYFHCFLMAGDRKAACQSTTCN